MNLERKQVFKVIICLLEDDTGKLIKGNLEITQILNR